MARRLAAILFTDLAGSTQLAQADERAALAVLRENQNLAREILPGHQGRLVKSTGDGWLAEFPNALDAVEAAVDFQRRAFERSTQKEGSALRVRIGIHVGDVESEGTDILGDAVNIAARIEPIAEAGGICLSGPAYDQVSNKVPYTLEDLGPTNLKGVARPIHVYRVVLPWTTPVSTVGPGRGDRPRLAVLPLANLSTDPENEPFADGLTEEFISTFSQIPGLDVISRTSVMPFKTPGTPIPDIGRKLKVGWVLEGSVRRAGNRVRITVQLIEAENDQHLWAEKYDRGLEDIFATQSEIAEKVAGALRIRLGESEKARLSRVPTQDTEAHLLYLRGVARLTSGSQNIQAALRDFEGATKKDPSYARAYAWSANCYYSLALSEVMPMAEAARRGEEAVARALSLDPDLAEAHLANALFLDSPVHQDAESAKREVSRVIELNPSLPGAYLILSHLSATRSEEIERAVDRALELDPLSPITKQAAADTLLYGVGKIDRAAALYEQMIHADPTLRAARNNLGLCRVLQGRPEEGVREIRTSIQLEEDFSPPARADFVFALVRAGRTDEARAVLQELLDHHRTTGVGSISIALSYARLGEIDTALQWLETAYREQSPYVFMLDREFGIEELRADPRYPAFLSRACGAQDPPRV